MFENIFIDISLGYSDKDLTLTVSATDHALDNFHVNYQIMVLYGCHLASTVIKRNYETVLQDW